MNYGKLKSRGQEELHGILFLNGYSENLESLHPPILFIVMMRNFG